MNQSASGGRFRVPTCENLGKEDMMLAFSDKGVKVPVHESVLNKGIKEIKKLPSPKEVYIPLIQHVGDPAHPIVKKGDKVSIGERIAESDKFISCYVHSSISGEVKAICDIPHPKLQSVQGIIIVNDRENRVSDAVLDKPRRIDNISAEDIIGYVREAGVAGMGGAAFPAHVKLSPPKNKQLNSFILNGAECEPYLSADASLMIQKSKFIVLGMKLAMKSIGVKTGYIGIEKSNKIAGIRMKEAIDELKNSVFGAKIKLNILPDSYPQGAEKQIIKTILNREVPPDSLPYDVGVVVNNVATCYAIYQAVAFSKPLYERVVTIAGGGVKQEGNFIVPVGTKIKELCDICGVKKDIRKVILGGPMMGDTQFNFDTPIVKGTGGIIVFSGEMDEYKEMNCIKCGKCVDVCPMNLTPAKIAKLVKYKRWKDLDSFNINDCVECGCCAYICPSRIPLVHLIQVGKAYKNKEEA